MTNDEAKDVVLQYLLKMQYKYPTRHIGYPKAQIIIDVRKDFREIAKDIQHLISMAIDYLDDEGYLKTQTEQKVKYYRLSSKAQDKILSPSAYARERKQDGSIRLFNDGGILVMGNNYGTVTIDKRVQITNELDKIAELIQKTTTTDDANKADLIQSVATLQAQIKMQEPDKTIVSRAWASLQGASTIGGVIQLIGQLEPLIHHIIKGGVL